MATTTATGNTGGGSSLLSTLTLGLFDGDASAAGQVAVDNRSFSQKYGSWDSDRKKLTEMTPEEMQAQLASTLRKREAVVIRASAGLGENGERLTRTTGNGYVASKENASSDVKLGVHSTGNNYAHFAAMAGRIAA